MPESDKPKHRASLQGKGRAILLGEHADPPARPALSQLEDADPQLAALLAGGRSSDAEASDAPRIVPGASRPLYEAPGPPVGVIQAPNDVDEIPDLPGPGEGGLMIAPPALDSLPEAVGDPFPPYSPRHDSMRLFPATASPADSVLLERLVRDEAVFSLWQEIDALHPRLIEAVRGDRCNTDIHQKELLEASELLLQGRANYDNARARVVRIKADLSRQEKVERDIARYRPPLLRYYLVWGAAWALAMAFGPALLARVGGSDALNLPIVFYPVMFGVLGALVSGYLTLDRHTTHLRDFDPLHVSWYLFNPPLGAVMGLLMLLLYAIVNQDVIQPGAAEPMERAVVWLLCALAGMNQHAVLRHMFRLLDRLASGAG